jgi:hypothetical protein
MVFEGIPGGPMDCWQGIQSAEQHLDKSLEIVRRYLPWEAERCQSLELTDDKGFLSGRFTPMVRKPVLELPSGRHVLGMADALVVNDPITGQGSNNATKACKVYLDAILARGEQPYSRDWMEQTFEQFWDYAQWVAQWTNSLLTPPPPHILNLLGAAGQSPALASAVAKLPRLGIGRWARHGNSQHKALELEQPVCVERGDKVGERYGMRQRCAITVGVGAGARVTL